MKRQVRFVDDAQSYRFELVDGNDAVFEISKDTLVFSAKDFYATFFKDLDSKPVYELVQPTDALSGQPKHVFETVEAIFKKTCDSIDGGWFKEPASETVEPG